MRVSPNEHRRMENSQRFERYAIVSRTDIADAMRKLQQSDKSLGISHELVTVPTPGKNDQIALVPAAVQKLHPA